MQVRLLFRALVVFGVVVGAVAQTASRQSQTLLPTSTARERADYFMKQGMEDSARFYYQLWTTANPRDTNAWLMLARLYANRGEPERALAAISSAVQAGLASSDALNSDSSLVHLTSHSDRSKLLARIVSNAREQSQYLVRHARQERLGRYRVLLPPNYDSIQRYHLVLLLHGNGNEPIMMLRWAKALGLRRAIIVCPEAPYVKINETINQGRIRLSAAGEDLAAPDSMNPLIVELSAQWYRTVLDDAERTLPLIAGSLPIVVGFSQGGFYAQVLATRYPDRIRAAVLLCSSYYAFGGIAERLEQLRRYGIEVLQVHGTKDTIVPIQTAWLTGQMYQQADVRYNMIEFEGEHWIPDNIARQVGQWIDDRLR